MEKNVVIWKWALLDTNAFSCNERFRWRGWGLFRGSRFLKSIGFLIGGIRFLVRGIRLLLLGGIGFLFCFEVKCERFLICNVRLIFDVRLIFRACKLSDTNQEDT